MKKIRIGNDIFVTWNIFDAEGAPYDLTGKNIGVSLIVRSKSGQRIVESSEKEIDVEGFFVEGNKIKFYFYGKNQSQVGVYDLKFVENDNLRGMVTYDIQGAFEIVSHSWQEEQGVTTTIELENVELTSQIDNTIMAEIQKKADKVTDAEEGNLAGLNSTGNLVDSGIPASEVTSLREDLTAENGRAEQTEQALSDKIDADVAAEKARAEEAENGIGAALIAEGARATAAEQTLASRATALEGRAAALESGKQNVIADLQTIRSGAALGATAMQPNAFWINE